MITDNWKNNYFFITLNVHGKKVREHRALWISDQASRLDGGM